MQTNPIRSFLCLMLIGCMAGCTTLPTLQQVARKRQIGDKNDVRQYYEITDRDVLDYTDAVKRKLSTRFNRDSSIRYSASAGQLTLGALAGAAQTFGWSTGTASTLGIVATYIFGLGNILDLRGTAQACEAAARDIEAAETGFYRLTLGMRFVKDEKGKSHIDDTKHYQASGIPSATHLTGAGETLYYRTIKILNVLEDALAKKIPALQDLKTAKGE